MIRNWRTFRIIIWRYLFIGLFIIPIMSPIMCFHGCKKLYKYIALQIRIACDDSGKVKLLSKGDTEQIYEAYLNGQLRRDELERYIDKENTFEFNIPFDMYNKLLYIENGYNETLNSFFKRHGCIEFKQGIRVIYLPEYMETLVEQDMLGYYVPWIKDVEKQKFSAQDVMQFIFDQLSYPEDAKKIQHGILLFDIGFQYNKYGVEVYFADYHHLEEGDDDYIMSQLTRIAESLYKVITRAEKSFSRPKIFFNADTTDAPQEGLPETYADRTFNTIYNDEISILVKEVRDRVIKLHQFGISEDLIWKMINTSPVLSRLIITRDYRIMLPEYGNMEIKMEPLNKAVYLLFLRHPEGIVFKHLPDYEQELLEIYAMLKPMGINDKVRKSISDVCNPCKNSINEKCARIRGAFISQFDESLAKNYFITGYRGYPKGITFPRKFVVWEE